MPGGRDTTERDEELEILVAERVGGGDAVDVENAEHLLRAGHEGCAHGAAHALAQDRLSAEAAVGDCIVGEHGHAAGDDGVDDGAGHRFCGQVADAAPAHAGHELATRHVEQEDGDPIHREHLERGVHDRLEQALVIELAREALGKIEQQLELAGLPRGGIGVTELEQASLGVSIEVREGVASTLDPDLAHDGAAGRAGTRLQRLDAEGGAPEGQRIEGRGTPARDLVAIDLGAVAAAEVDDLQCIGLHAELGVTPGDGGVGHREVARGAAAEDVRVAGRELERLGAVGADQAKDRLAHA